MVRKAKKIEMVYGQGTCWSKVTKCSTTEISLQRLQTRKHTYLPRRFNRIKLIASSFYTGYESNKTVCEELHKFISIRSYNFFVSTPFDQMQ
uniref:AlNc14C39G3385 protein n=1 Tax=Albugo laibachii Nc14 TaxID=890382 RepID=F0W9B8_9STRA|nr:AlNc14C39G3385 [Albugo laibachii Nc14]CCA18377.1 AlNc14C49G3910 [Albugo laibachii Nc14]|eukprot:CCA18377.1 AlNc14C49G3910 [Albugo laibachii Nc14]